MTLDVWDRPEAVAAGGAPADAVDADRSGPRSSRRRRLLVVVAVLLVFALLVAGVLVLRRRGAHGEPLDPRNASPDGAQAVARVLQERGIAVDIARGQAALQRVEAIDGRTTVVVTQTGDLSEQTAARAWQQFRGAGRVVLVEPSRFVLDSLSLEVSPVGGDHATRSVAAGCAIPGLSSSDTISAVGRSYTTSQSGASSCFTFDGASALVRLPPPAAGGPEVVVLGAGAILSNREVTRHDNAGVAVRMLSRGDRLVWYLPSVLDVSAADSTARSEVPRALGPLALLGLFALLAAMLWRGRRFGPLVVEPLPAVVKAIETTESRGRLYRRARDTGRAGAVLRAASTRRLATYLGLPPGSAPGPVAEAAARTTGRPLTDVLALLAGPPPEDEDAMIRLAQNLSTLEKEVHRP